MSSDAGLAQRLQAGLPEGWAMSQAVALEDIGGFEEVLQHRFLLLDLDDASLDPLGVVAEIRSGLLLNIAVFTLGGDAAARDAARLARADRFFDHAEAVEVMQRFCVQYGW